MNKTMLQLIGAVAFIGLVLIIIPWLITITGRKDLYYTFTSVALLAIISAGVWLTFYIGRINIGQGAYALIGGYVAGILMTHYAVSFWLSLPLAGIFCAVISILIGLPILRLRGVYFSMVTLVSTEVARLTAMALPITNGAKGLTNIPLPSELSLFGLTLVPSFASLENSNRAFYFLAVILMLLCFAGMYRLVHSRMGQLCLSLQQNEELASSIGVNVTALRIIAYAISSFLGGIGGAIFAAISQSIYPASFTVQDSVNFMLNCFLGGLNYVFGPIIGTFALYFGWDLLFQTGEYQLLIYAIIIIALMLLLPNGLLSLRSIMKTGVRS